MEYLETYDPEKKKLIETSERHKRELKKEVKSITENTERVVTNALFIAGALALTYFALSQIAGSRKKKKSKQAKKQRDEDEDVEIIEASTPSLFSQIGDAVVTQGTLILLDLAKEKLAEYLNQRKSANEDS